MNDHANDFNDTATDLLLALISLHATAVRGMTADRADIIADIEKSLAELPPNERDDLAPHIRAIAEQIIH